MFGYQMVQNDPIGFKWLKILQNGLICSYWSECVQMVQNGLYSVYLNFLQTLLKYFLQYLGNITNSMLTSTTYCQTPVLGQGFSPRLRLGVDFTFVW